MPQGKGTYGSQVGRPRKKYVSGKDVSPIVKQAVRMGSPVGQIDAVADRVHSLLGSTPLGKLTGAIATGTDGQVLTSTGAGSPPAFEDAAAGGISTGKAIAMALIFG